MELLWEMKLQLIFSGWDVLPLAFRLQIIYITSLGYFLPESTCRNVFKSKLKLLCWATNSLQLGDNDQLVIYLYLAVLCCFTG